MDGGVSLERIMNSVTETKTKVTILHKTGWKKAEKKTGDRSIKKANPNHDTKYDVM